MRKNSLSIIGIVGVPAKYGGFETFVDNIIQFLDKYDVTVYCSKVSYHTKMKSYKGALLKYVNLPANGPLSILYDAVSIMRSINSDNLLILGVSGSWILPLFKILSPRTNIITNIDGIEWRREKWGYFTKLLLKYLEKISVKYSNKIILDNKALINDFKKNNKNFDKKIRIIEYGGDHVNFSKAISQSENYFVSVSRIEPENNVELILKSFSKLTTKKIIYIGNWQYSNFGKELFLKYSHFENIELLDPIYDQQIIDKYRSNSLAYIHGHSQGGTNPSLVEAMSLNLPCICYNCTYNIETTRDKAFYFKNSEELNVILEDNNIQKLRKNASNMKDIANISYKWIEIANKYLKELI